MLRRVKNGFLSRRLLQTAPLALTLLLCLTARNALARKKIVESIEREESVDEYYRAMFKYGKGDYAGSIAIFEEIERIYPSFSKMPSVKVMHAYLLHLKREYERSIQECDAFISLYPKSAYIPYLSYLKAMSQYRQITGLTKSYELIIASRNEMHYISTKYKDTVYGQLATERLRYLDNVITNYSFSIGETYYQDEDYFAAINRYKRVLEREKNYLKKSFSPLAYFRLFECYYILGMDDLSLEYKAKFVESMSNFYGDVSFVIEGIVDYVTEDERGTKGRKNKFDSGAINMNNLESLRKDRSGPSSRRLRTGKPKQP